MLYLVFSPKETREAAGLLLCKGRFWHTSVSVDVTIEHGRYGLEALVCGFVCKFLLPEVAIEL